MRIGVLLPTRESVMSGRPDVAPLLEMAERAEALGFDSVWVGDSITARPRHEPLTLLAAAAVRTRRVILGTAVLLPALRHPLVLAHLVATLDRIAQGRLILGVGIAGDTPAIRKEFEAVGVPYAQRAGRAMETIELCRALWRGEPVTRTGKYWSLDGVQLLPTPHRAGGPPIWIGGSRNTAITQAAQRLDGWFAISPKPEVFKDGWERIQALARAADRPLSQVMPALYTTVNLKSDAAAAEAELRRFMESYYSVPFEVLARAQGCYAGSVEGCVDWLARFRAAGVRHVVLRFGGGDQLGQLEHAAKSILPQLATA